MKKSKKIKIQLLIVLAFFTVAAVAITLVSLHYFQKVHDVYAVSSAAHRMHDRYMDAMNAQQKFIYLETSKSDFFKTGKSIYLNAYENELSKMKAEMTFLRSRNAYRDFEMDHKVDELGSELSKFETLFSFTLEKIRSKGFKDFGVEGKMRAYVHDLETHGYLIGLANVLMLRRHEKDFLLRNDESYVTKLKDKVTSIKQRVWSNPKIKMATKDTLIMLLQNYEYSFLELVKFTKEIGHKDEQGMSEMLAQSTFTMAGKFEEIDQAVMKKESSLVDYIRTILVIVVFNIVIVCLFTVYLFTRKIPTTAALGANKEVHLMKEEKFILAESI